MVTKVYMKFIGTAVPIGGPEVTNSKKWAIIVACYVRISLQHNLESFCGNGFLLRTIFQSKRKLP